MGNWGIKGCKDDRKVGEAWSEMRKHIHDYSSKLHSLHVDALACLYSTQV